MKVTKRQLSRIIREERKKLFLRKDFGSNSTRKSRIKEGRMKEMEMELIEEIIELLENSGAIQPGLPMERMYDEALHWVEKALVPHLQSMKDANHGGEY